MSAFFEKAAVVFAIVEAVTQVILCTRPAMDNTTHQIVVKIHDTAKFMRLMTTIVNGLVKYA